MKKTAQNTPKVLGLADLKRVPGGGYDSASKKQIVGKATSSDTSNG